MIKKELLKEISYWLPKAKEELEKIKKGRVKDKDFLINIEAYLQDAEYFLKKEDLIKSFEAVIWAWAWLEIGKRKNVLE